MRSVLFIDDDEDDRDLIQDLLRRKRPDLDLIPADNGLKGFDYLEKVGAVPENLPCVVILDLNMPGWNGKETFTRIRAQKTLMHIPIAILTSSTSPADQNFFSGHHDVAFYTKPESLLQFDALLDEIVSNC